MGTRSLTLPAESSVGGIVKLIHCTTVPKAAASRRPQQHCDTCPGSIRVPACAVASALLGSAGNSSSFPNLGRENPCLSYACPNHDHTQPFPALFLSINYLKYSTGNSYKCIFLTEFNTGCPAAERFNSWQGGGTLGPMGTKKRYMNITRATM